MNVEEKWDRFKQKITPKEEARIIPINEQGQVEGEYTEKGKPARKPVYRLLASVAVAASVLLVVGLGWKFFVGKPDTPVARNAGENTDSTLFVVRHEVNTTGKEKRIQLPDGSIIVLEDKSGITYREPFLNGRDITLVGKAHFKVAKDNTRPFTVISDDISTTALGTEFTVTVFANERRIIVRLYEGKVVVRPVEKSNWRMKNDVYLLPGQELIYDNDALAKVRAFQLKNATAPGRGIKEESGRDDPSLPKDNKGSWYMFNNQSLEQVLDQLSALYDVKIVYNKKDVRNIYFTGRYNKSESVETILKRIAILNDLTITKKDSAFIISR
jgi:transmembrane sensor